MKLGQAYKRDSVSNSNNKETERLLDSALQVIKDEYKCLNMGLVIVGDNWSLQCERVFKLLFTKRSITQKATDSQSSNINLASD